MQDVANTLITAAVAILTPALLYAMRRFIAYLEKKTEFEVSEKAKADMDDALVSAIHFAEEEARRRARNRPGAEPMLGDSKRQLARVKARSFAPDKLHSVSDDVLGDMIDARLNSLRPSMRPPDDDGTRYHSLEDLARAARGEE